jgi:hypothetical protein
MIRRLLLITLRTHHSAPPSREFFRRNTVVIRGLLVLMIILIGVIPPVAAQAPEPDPIEGTLVFLEDGHLFRYRDGSVEPVCGIPLTIDDADTPLTVQYSERFDVAYAPETGLAAIAARNDGPYGDHGPGFNSPGGATALYLCDVNTGEFERISPDPVVGSLHVTPVFSPDETQIAWLAMDRATTRVLMYDIASKQVTTLYENPGFWNDLARARPLVWGEAGLLLRGEHRDEGDVLTIIDPIKAEVITEQLLFRESMETPEIAYGSLLTWATADDTAVVVYALGLPETRLLLYYNPEADEHFIGRGELVVSPAAPLPADWIYEQPPEVHLWPFRYPGGQAGLAAITAGPSTFNGMPGGFAFSPDGRYLAMLVNEGIDLYDGNDIYLLNSADTYGSLGYTITAQRVGDTAHDWNNAGPQRVFWGHSQVIIRGFQAGSPLSTWSPYG